jgi:hypothetical protein
VNEEREEERDSDTNILRDRDKNIHGDRYTSTLVLMDTNIQKQNDTGILRKRKADTRHSYRQTYRKNGKPN